MTCGRRFPFRQNGSMSSAADRRSPNCASSGPLCGTTSARDSDLDVLVRLTPGADWSLLDHVAMEEELAGIVGRKVDLVSQRAIERSSNWIRRKAILEGAEPYLASR